MYTTDREIDRVRAMVVDEERVIVIWIGYMSLVYQFFIGCFINGCIINR